MRIGVVVHGPNVIDSGYALKLINLITEYGDVSVRLGGTMGRTAVIDNSLENTPRLCVYRDRQSGLKIPLEPDWVRVYFIDKLKNIR